MNSHNLVYISVDVETAGPTPGEYAMLSIGACLVDDPEVCFYVELIPDKARIEPSAIKISGLDPHKLEQNGTAPYEAMQSFEHWVFANTPENMQPVFVAYNAAFDWMFVADYFQRYLGRNPFGHRALDMKALYMGMHAVPWDQTSMAALTRALGLSIELSHHALLDAQDQARIFDALLRKMMKG